MAVQMQYTVALLCTVILREEAFPENFHTKKYLEIRTTNGFADDGRLGQGGSAHVYKGTLEDQRLVAVKRIFAESEGFFINELKIISRLIHRNLVKFIGWYKIAMGLASALHYLHEGAEQCVLHRDIKSANVLLDTDFTTKLGDFGVAKLVDQRLRTQTTRVVGTPGYLAPEICRNKELIETFYENEMQCLLMVGLWCTHPNDRERPNAEQVIRVLQLEAPLPELPLDMHEHPAPLPRLSIDN
ncbi:L-type lectin-domain containing receptor kinase IX.2-like [Durio zibethinus]|uniref:L-type lectin-domain containing receptor kinase IX.2-like n=1 Tax=Durio zibethinus TaxID=66656 RepID=A0A6P6ALR3_DURZI|nr:L-type lectin-domain containing receptor kinase IX.2-like [Durio zibethinus]